MILAHRKPVADPGRRRWISEHRTFMRTWAQFATALKVVLEAAELDEGAAAC
jgi:hypothetical protein